MKLLKPEELQNSSSVKSTRTSLAWALSSRSCTWSTKGLSTAAGLTVLMVPRNWTRDPAGSTTMLAEYFSSETWMVGARAPGWVGLDMGDSWSFEHGGAQAPPGEDRDPVPVVGDGEIELGLETDARQAEPAALVHGRLRHGPQVALQRVGLAVDPPQPGLEVPVLLGR